MAIIETFTSTCKQLTRISWGQTWITWALESGQQPSRTLDFIYLYVWFRFNPSHGISRRLASFYKFPLSLFQLLLFFSRMFFLYLYPCLIHNILFCRCDFWVLKVGRRSSGVSISNSFPIVDLQRSSFFSPTNIYFFHMFLIGAENKAIFDIDLFHETDISKGFVSVNSSLELRQMCFSMLVSISDFSIRLSSYLTFTLCFCFFCA